MGTETETQRKSARTKVACNEIVYLHFQSGNGAIVLDASAKGLGFQAADALQANETLHFRLSAQGFPEIALSGRVVWLDSTRKRGGLHLVVPAESVAVFGDWRRKYLDAPAPAGQEIRPPSQSPSRSPAPAATSAAPRKDPRPVPTPTRRQEVARSPVLQQESPAPTASPEPPPAAPPPPPPFAPPPPPASPFLRSDSVLGGRGPVFVSEWQMPPEPSRVGRNILVVGVILAFCFVVAGGSYYLAGKRELGNILVSLGQQISGTGPQAKVPGQNANAVSPAAPSSGAVDAPSSAAPAPSSAFANPAGTASPSTAPNVPQQPASAPQAPVGPSDSNPAATSQTAPQPNASSSAAGAGAVNAGKQSADPLDRKIEAELRKLDEDSRSSARSAPAAPAPRQGAADADNGGEDLNEALVYLRSSNSQDSAVAAELLWSAIGKGNTQADLVLGDLYMRGQGAVGKNCRQAEVLLHAALVADVPGANEKIGELQTYGCR